MGTDSIGVIRACPRASKGCRSSRSPTLQMLQSLPIPRRSTHPER
jgi:hypothetical protein